MRWETDVRSARPPEHAHGAGVLIVEDDDDSRDILSTFVAANGYPVMTARHGRDVLDRMPVMDGWTFCEALLADPLLAAIPVVVLSAVHNVVQAVSGLSVASYLEKPYDFLALLRTLKEYR